METGLRENRKMRQRERQGGVRGGAEEVGRIKDELGLGSDVVRL